LSRLRGTRAYGFVAFNRRITRARYTNVLHVAARDATVCCIAARTSQREEAWCLEVAGPLRLDEGGAQRAEVCVQLVQLWITRLRRTAAPSRGV
jgi:hypothetical protein